MAPHLARLARVTRAAHALAISLLSKDLHLHADSPTAAYPTLTPLMLCEDHYGNLADKTTGGKWYARARAPLHSRTLHLRFLPTMHAFPAGPVQRYRRMDGPPVLVEANSLGVRG